MTNHQRKLSAIVSKLLDWFSESARDLPWRRTQDPYAIWVSEIMLQQTQVKTVLPFWERWMRELPTIEAAAGASSEKIHKLWEGLGYYTRVRSLQKAARLIVEKHDGKFPKKFEDILELPGIGRYTAGAISSIAFNEPKPILDGNVMRVLTRIFGIAEDPREKKTNGLLWQMAEELVLRAQTSRTHTNERSIYHDVPSHTALLHNDAASLIYLHESEKNSRANDSPSPLPSPAGRGRVIRRRQETSGDSCSHLNQSLMELGALVCTPRNPQCSICPVKKLCVAFKENRADELPNIAKREAATARRFVAFVVEYRGKFLVRQRPENVVNAHLWEFPNVEVNGAAVEAAEIFKSHFGVIPTELKPLTTVKHSITRYRITLEAFQVQLKKMPKTDKVWLPHSELDSLAFTSAHRKVLGRLKK